MMKRSFLYVCAGALALAACTNDEVIAPVENSGIAIGFGTVTGPAATSRGAATDIGVLKTSNYGFNVVAYTQEENITSWDDYITKLGTFPSAPNFMNNQKVTWNATTNKWEYDPVKNWPGKVDGTNYGRVTFFGFGGRKSSGDNQNIQFDNSGKKLIYEYTTDAAPSSQEDLVADVLFDQKWENDNTKVNFQFEHILSKIGFKAKLAAEASNATVKVTSLIVNYTNDKVINKAIYNFDTTSNVSTTDSWTTTSATKFTNNSTTGKLNSNDVTISTTANLLNDVDKYLMLIPQTTDTNGDLTVKLTYTIETGSSSKETVTYPLTYKIPAVEYKQGKAYTYTFIFTLNAVVFDTNLTVSGWDEQPETTVPI